MLAVLEEVKKETMNLSDEILVQEDEFLKDVELSEQSEVFENGDQWCTLEELITWMIIQSDNVATNVLIQKFGMNLINQYIKDQLKCNNTKLQRKMVDKDAVKKGLDNYITQADMDCMFEKLFKKEILNEELCEKAINILYHQRINNQISRYVYKPYKFAHKTGSLEYLNSDVGVINIKDKLYYIGISIYDLSNKKPNRKLAGKIGKEIISYLDNKSY